jgi:hypothetical protein
MFKQAGKHLESTFELPFKAFFVEYDETFEDESGHVGMEAGNGSNITSELKRKMRHVSIFFLHTSQVFL